MSKNVAHNKKNVAHKDTGNAGMQKIIMCAWETV
jgi:hypothetical protein